MLISALSFVNVTLDDCTSFFKQMGANVEPYYATNYIYKIKSESITGRQR